MSDYCEQTQTQTERPAYVNTLCENVGGRLCWELEDSYWSGSLGSRQCRQGSSSQPSQQDRGLDPAVQSLEKHGEWDHTHIPSRIMYNFIKGFLALANLYINRNSSVSRTCDETMSKYDQCITALPLNITSVYIPTNSTLLNMKANWLTCCDAAVAGGSKRHAMPIDSHWREAQQVHRLWGLLIIWETLYLEEGTEQLMTQRHQLTKQKYTSRAGYNRPCPS